MKTSVTFKNITFSFESAQFDDFSGECYFKLPYEIIEKAIRFIDHEEIETFVTEELKTDFGYLEKEDETYDVTNADVAICLIEYIVENIKESITIPCQYEHIIWLFHDLQHVINDATDFDIYIDDFQEEKAIRVSIDKLIENGISIPYHILEKTDREYEKRFNVDHSTFFKYALDNDNQEIPAITY